jgi:hypothetical protein
VFSYKYLDQSIWIFSNKVDFSPVTSALILKKVERPQSFEIKVIFKDIFKVETKIALYVDNKE